MTRARRWAQRFGLFALALLACDQLVLYALLAGGSLGDKRIAPFDPPLFNARQRQRVQDIRELIAAGKPGRSILDPELGWCPRPGRFNETYAYDWSGSRLLDEPLARERRAGVRRIVVLGCSYARGDEVAAQDSWAGRLQLEQSRLEGPELELANLGMGGYGIDQCLLRWRRDGAPLAPDEVWLALMPTALMRLTSQFPPVQNHWTGIVSFKPRFTLDEAGALALHPMPAPTLRAELALLEDQAAFVRAFGQHDLWLRRLPAAYAPRGSHPAHYLALGRLALTWLDHRGREPRGWFEDERAELPRLARALCLRLAAEVQAAGAQLRLCVLPSREDLRDRHAHAGGWWDALLSGLAAAGLETFDASAALEAAGMRVDDALWMPGRHYSPRANAIVAELLRERWLRSPRAASK